MRTPIIRLALVWLVSLGAIQRSHGAAFQVPISGAGGVSVTTGSVTVLAPLVLSGTEIQLPARISQLNTNFAFTNVNQVFSNTIVVNPGTNDIANGILLTNAVKLAGTLASGTRPMLVRLMPGKYGTPTNTLPSVMMAVDNVSTYWEPGAEWWSGTEGGDASFMWEDTAGFRTNVNIYGKGRFWYTNDGGNVIYLEGASKMYAGARSMYATNSSSTAAPITWGGAASDLTVDIDDFIESGIYDAVYGDVGAGQKFRGFIREVRAKGDLFEFTGDSPEWGNVDIRFDIGRLPQIQGQPTWVQVGGRTKIRGSQVFITSTNASIGSSSTATNGVLEVGEVQYPADGKIEPIRGVDNTLAHLLIRNTTIIAPSNMVAVAISNSAARPLILENVTLQHGWNTTTWGRGLTPSFVDIAGGLHMRPYQPAGAQLTVRGTNYFAGARNIGGLIQEGVATFAANINQTGGMDLTTDGNIFSIGGFIDSLLVTNQLNLPNGAGPFTPADGDLYFDNNIWATGRGALVTWDGTANVIIPAVLASDTPSNGQVLTWNTGGTMTWETTSGGGSGGTNFPAVLLLVGNTNLTLQAGKETKWLQITNGNHGVDADLAVPESGHLFTIIVSNSHTAAITNTFYTNGVAATYYSPLDKTNATGWITAAGGMTISEFTYLGSGKWIRVELAAEATRQIAGTGLIEDSGGVNGLDRTYSTRRYTNYASANITINASTDVAANYTNAVAANNTITLATPVIGTSGSLGLVSGGSAYTLAILSPVAITWLSTNDTATATNILTTASKRSLFAWRVGMGTDGVSTNIHCWVKNQTP